MADASGRVAVYLDFDNIVMSWYDSVHGRNSYGRDRQRIAQDPSDPEIVERLTEARVDIGAVIDFKYTDVSAGLEVPGLVAENIHASAPIPAIGGIFRAYVVPNISITGEVTGFSVPEGLFDETRGNYWDVDFYGTVNFTNNIGVMAGYRSLDVGYTVETDFGDFRLNGLYLGGVFRY